MTWQDFLIKVILWLKRVLEEPDGKPSLKRFGITALLTTFIVSYLKIAIPSQQLLDIPSNWMMILGVSILGMGFISKMKGQ